MDSGRWQLVTGVLPYKLRGDFSYDLAAQIVELHENNLKQAPQPS